jgi:hypothetical protein
VERRAALLDNLALAIFAAIRRASFHRHLRFICYVTMFQNLPIILHRRASQLSLSVANGYCECGKEHAVTWLLVMVLEISVAMAVGFVLGRIWQIRCDLEQERAGDFTPPPIGRIPTSCATVAGGRLYY